MKYNLVTLISVLGLLFGWKVFHEDIPCLVIQGFMAGRTGFPLISRSFMLLQRYVVGSLYRELAF